MRFNSELERMEHPQVRLIPKHVWKNADFFNQEISEFELMLMEIASSELNADWTNVNFQSLDDRRKSAAWLALACGHPDMDDALLLDFSDRLKMEAETLFTCSAKIEKLSLLDTIVETHPNTLKAMLSISNGAYNVIFMEAAYTGHLSLIDHMMKLAPDDVYNMISAFDFDAFQNAAAKGHLSVVNRLIEKLTELAPNHLQYMISSGETYVTLGFAISNDHGPVVNRLLQFPLVFAYVEMHDHEYGTKYIYPLVNEKLSDLRDRRETFEAEQPQAVFDITDPEEAKFCFYIIRNLIRRNQPELQDNIRFLIEIPSVKALLHTTVTPNQPNELYRLTLRVDNLEASEILRTVPAVNELAIEDEMYSREARGGFDLDFLTSNRESSMTALTSGEQKRLEAALTLYQPIINQQGAPVLIQALRDQLRARYEAHPAQVRTGNGRMMILPFSWDAWQEFSRTLSEDTRELALQAYYQHKDHTAFRYLSKPNPWMAKNASHVNYSDTGQWSTFEEYQPLIAMLYLGALDKHTLPCDGHTLETRLEHFIDEVAHIGRAHNWDKTRKNALGILEEYDDLQGDKPSCYSGVKRRLFQSVLGHPLLKILTKDDIKKELREYVHKHFKQSIEKHSVEAIEWKKAWDDVCETGQGGEALSAMNIPEEAQAALIEQLRINYPAQFDADLSFKTYIQERFKLNEQVATHAARFGGETDLAALLKPCVEKTELMRRELSKTRLESDAYLTSRAEEEHKDQTQDGSKRPGSPGAL